MPLFLSDEEFNQCAHDPYLVAEKADSFIKDLHRQLETLKAQADAASITAEQTCALLEQKYISLSSEYSKLESQIVQLNTSIEQQNAELAQAQSEKHQSNIKAISKDGEIQRLSVEASELHKSKRQLLELVEQKDLEISEKNATIKSYLDKIVNLTDDAALKQAHLHDKEAELARCNATCARLSQEKELFERHNSWLNEELTAKVGSLMELRRTHSELETDLTSKLSDVERQLSECSSALKWSKERMKELELKLTSAQEELCSSKEVSAANEERFSAEISTVAKLVDLYKESSEEWSRKAGDLEGVIKALETHFSQVEGAYKEKLEKELSARKQFEQEAAVMKEKLEKCELEMEKNRKADELSLLPISSFTGQRWDCGTVADEVHDNNQIIPKIPTGVSGTALAASLLRDGWSLAKMYEKYQEAVDALRHETLGRKQSEAILERVLFEIEEKAGIILDERAEHERMMEAYSAMSQKLQQSLSEQINLESAIEELKAELRRREREYDIVQKEIVDLQKQVTVLLKECRDVQLRCGSDDNVYSDDVLCSSDIEINDESDTEKVISERLLTFRDINGLVEQNVQLRSLVRSLSDQNAKKDSELREGFQMELQKKTEEAAGKVAAVLQRAEEQGRMIESLHSSVAMYKRLYEEEQKLHGSYLHSSETVPEIARKDLMLLLEGSQDASKKAQEQATQRVKNLEEQLDKLRSEAISIRLERDKFALEANFAREKLDRYMKECEHQRTEVNGVLARNVEFSQIIVDYQRKLRENSDSLHAAEESVQKLTMEISLLKQEKELHVNSEKRACDEVRSLSERVHRLQASLDTIHSTDEVREEARVMEKRKREEYLQHLEREWAQAKKELQEERDNVRSISLDRGHTLNNAMKQVEEMGKKLGDALHTVAVAEARAAVAEAKCSDLEGKLKSIPVKVTSKDGGLEPSASADEVNVDVLKLNEEIEKLREEAKANKDHMLQYKGIAQVNEAAMKQIEFAYETFKAEAEKSKKSLEAEVLSLRERISEIETDSMSKSKEAASAVAMKEASLDSALADIARLKEESSLKMSQIMGMEMQVSSLKEDLEKEHQRWRAAQGNYERQVMLQSETIQELTKTSQALAGLQEEASALRKFADSQKRENDMLKEKMEAEKSVLEQAKNHAEMKYNEIDEQNKILHSRLEALHINLAEKERNSASASGNLGSESQNDNQLQTVVSYLRRSKEIAETEISLLKQEKLRLQSQLESALKASETAQLSLHNERAKFRASPFSDEEFKSLQIQIRETTLLRESNLQLREENKHNFEECQKLREVARKARDESEGLLTLLREKQIELETHLKESELQRIEKGDLKNQIDELLRTCNNIDVEKYDRLKNDFHNMQVNLVETEVKLEEARRGVAEKQNAISCLEQDITHIRSELTEKENRINDNIRVETTLKVNNEKQRKKITQLKKDNEELSKEKQSLSKQLEDFKQGKRPSGDSSNEQMMKEKEKEKDTRIQMLEKMVERFKDDLQKHKEEIRKEKEENRKEKATRMKNEGTMFDMAKTCNQEKTKLVDEIQRLKHAIESIAESGGPVEHLSLAGLEQNADAYVLGAENIGSFVEDVLGGQASLSEPPSTVDTSSLAITVRNATPQAVPSQSAIATTVGLKQIKTTDEKEKRRSNVSNQNAEGRKQRKLIRPNLEPTEELSRRIEEPSGDTEMPETDGASNAEGKVANPLDVESQGELTVPVQSSGRKRLAAASNSELHAESQADREASLSKKSKGSDSLLESSAQPAVLAENLEPPSVSIVSFEAGSGQSHAADGLASYIVKDEVHTTYKQGEDSKPSMLDGTSQVETQNDVNDISEELLDSTKVLDDITDEGSKDGEEEGTDQTNAEAGSEKEDGEFLPDVTVVHDGDVSTVATSPEQGEAQNALPELSNSGEEGAVLSAGEVAETTSSEMLVNEKTDVVEKVDMVDESDKSNNEQEVETEPSPAFGVSGSCSPSDPADTGVSNQGSIVSDVVEPKEGVATEKNTDVVEPKEAVPTENIIKLDERAKQRAEIRRANQMAGVQPSPRTPVVPVQPSPRTPVARRGRGYANSAGRTRGRGLGRGRGGRGQASDEKK